MVNFINPIDLSILLFITVISVLGIRNGFIIELKKNINLLFSLLLTHIIMVYIMKLYSQSDMINFILYIVIFISLILLIGLIIDLAIQHLPIISIEKNINKLIGLLLAALKSIILVSTILFFINLLPMQENIKSNFFLKANEGSVLFKICNKLQSFIIN